MLQNMLESIASSDDTTVGHPILHSKGPRDCAVDLKHQIDAFWKGEYPFNVSANENITDPLEWWTRLERHEHGQVLAVSNQSVFIESIEFNSHLLDPCNQGLLHSGQLNAG
jgi:hypothetical protein